MRYITIFLLGLSFMSNVLADSESMTSTDEQEQINTIIKFAQNDDIKKMTFIKQEDIKVNGETCYYYAVGDNSQEKFTANYYYAIGQTSGNVYLYDIVLDQYIKQN